MRSLSPDSDVAVIITAAGSSSRMGGVKKEYELLPGASMTVLASCVETFLGVKPCAIVITFPANEGPEKAQQALAALPSIQGLSNVIFVAGGPNRQASVLNGLHALNPAPQYVLIHDGARPWASPALLKRVLDAVRQYGAAVPVVPLTDTPKEIRQNTIVRHFHRSAIRAVQTPQGFEYAPLLAASEKAASDGHDYTDDAEIWAAYNERPVYAVEGELANKKITYPEDLHALMLQRVGTGWDLHRLVPGRPFLLGGVSIPADKGEEGHSDADVLCHAVTDALLGAAALADIGELYPPADDTWKNANSLRLLGMAWAKLQERGWKIINLDCIVVCETPKVLPFRDAIRQSLAGALGCSREQVFVKGKTAEKLGAIGSGDAVAARVVCLLGR